MSVTHLLLMGDASSLDPRTLPFVQLASLLKGILGVCGPLLTLPLDNTSFLNLVTNPFEFEMPRLIL